MKRRQKKRPSTDLNAFLEAVAKLPDQIEVTLPIKFNRTDLMLLLDGAAARRWSLARTVSHVIANSDEVAELD